MDYSKPLMEFMETLLPSDERVILVCHSQGGACVSLAMEKYPHKIAVAVFVSALMPCLGFDMDKIYEKYKRPREFYMDCKYEYGEDGQLISTLFGPDYMSTRLFPLCPPEANAAEACLDICEERLKNIPESQDRVCFSRMKELLTRGLTAVGSSLGHHDATCVFTGSEFVVNPTRRPKNRVLTRGAKGVKRGGKQRRPTNVDLSEEEEDEEAFGFGSPSQSPHECLTLEYACGSISISQPPEDNRTQENVSGSSSQPPDDCIVEEAIPCTEIRPRRVRKAVNRYTPR